jgi:serine O-acetyltransferase
MKYNGSTIRQWAGDSQWRAFRADFARFREHGYTGWGSEGLWALAIYRLQRFVRLRRPQWAWAPLHVALAVVRKFISIVTLVDLHPEAQIGPGLIIAHGGPVRVHGATKIGADCSLHHVCTIGAGSRPGGAVIGDHVYIGCHSSIIGAVTIGDNAVIAPNSLVISDVPSGCTAIGVPAKTLPVMRSNLLTPAP